jgi:hypothetical protein
MKPCPKLYLYVTIMEKIVSYLFMIICCASDLIILFLNDLTLLMKVIKVKSPHHAMVPC